MRKCSRIITLTVGLVLLTCCLFAQRHSTVAIRPIDKTDTLAKFLDVIDIRTSIDEREKHKEIWKMDDVRKLAMKYANDGSIVFTMTEDKTNIKRGNYVIGLYRLVGENNTKLETYRLTLTSQIERFEVSSGKWKRIKSPN
ncbi:MAG: hypothetical protein C0490_25405 [Marivirga sp.]|nr:hypothetical protein [Marivirga sp.]